MSLEGVLVRAIALLLVRSCQALPQFIHEGHFLSNNSFIYYPDIGDYGDRALKCVTDSVNCCNNSTVGGWRDESGRPVYQGADGTTCLYVTRGDGVISLNRKRGCTDHTSGLWRCDIPDSSGESQSLYIYISNRRAYGQLVLLSVNFTLHTELRASVPEFTISCRTHGGPATTVQWTVNGVPVQENRYYETSQLILDTSLNSVYDTRLRVKGRKCGTYNCTISNNIRDYLPEASIDEVNGSKTIIVAREPTNLTTVIPESNSTHVNITVSWESQDYVVYYQPKEGPVISDRVSGGETDTHSLDGLQRGVTYYISIVALSPHLPSPLVGPITVIANPPLIYVETSPESLTTSPNNQFSVNCTARAEVDGQSIPVDIEWIRLPSLLHLVHLN
ncbi:hypothetical protein GBAR_LOCUS4333 [Geodia barretti]|uniref:Fibronectin type-III domain-containing protein n=1 Tax=Geodia barretti TaxID=519541 RepID=A0AA35R8F8_GEOBA|nr:hypothetical protein GBAR_LOCUS4333 [Geodia barretti]